VEYVLLTLVPTYETTRYHDPQKPEYGGYSLTCCNLPMADIL